MNNYHELYLSKFKRYNKVYIKVQIKMQCEIRLMKSENQTKTKNSLFNWNKNSYFKCINEKSSLRLKWTNYGTDECLMRSSVKWIENFSSELKASKYL